MKKYHVNIVATFSHSITVEAEHIEDIHYKAAKVARNSLIGSSAKLDKVEIDYYEIDDECD